MKPATDAPSMRSGVRVVRPGGPPPIAPRLYMWIAFTLGAFIILLAWWTYLAYGHSHLGVTGVFTLGGLLTIATGAKAGMAARTYVPPVVDDF